jgi:hypothetical protein
VGDVADGADVDGGLARDDLGRQRGEGAEVDCAWFGLLTATRLLLRVLMSLLLLLLVHVMSALHCTALQKQSEIR